MADRITICTCSKADRLHTDEDHAFLNFSSGECLLDGCSCKKLVAQSTQMKRKKTAPMDPIKRLVEVAKIVGPGEKPNG